ncbi:hypothetical protein D0T25_07775 [Duganella sp. BJB488]|uniref:hypothetical protein n=1 Tax=unclassified Duganella TaxID=2636909 RepID=UPI000ED29415|nr:MULTISPECIES: hypothetical protein [unclassified Duganella]RFP24944.1 hypothetical protein D0T25_07775 [Duganella sp. BJB488]
MKSTLKLAAALCAVAAASASHAETVIANSGGHAKAATQQASIYLASCPGIAYQLRIDKPEKSVQFSVDTGNGPTVTDLSATPFGAAMRGKALYGNFGFSCAADALNIDFIGFELRQGAQPQPSEYRLTVAKNGAIVADNGLVEEKLAFVNQMLAKP